MSDALPLPPRPSLEQYKKLAKDFQHACKSDDPAEVREWCARWAENLARLQGLNITPDVQKQITRDTEQMERRWHEFKKTHEQSSCSLADAQLFIARSHGFASWPKFRRHLEEIDRANSPVSAFEAAADATVRGDLVALQKLLKSNPDLVRARSTREHRSTLLHYVSANGVEDFRQKTPKNVVDITELLLKDGADVNSESEAYGGHSTTLGLAATSYHPQHAGVQIPLLDLLIERGAIIDGPDGNSAVNACLHNGRGDAAEFLAARGARLDLEAAAGVGRLDLVKTFFREDGSPKPPATEEQMRDGFAWACEFGRTSVVDFLLQRGMKVDARLKHNGQTGLHWAAFEGHVETVKLLLDHGAPIDVKDASYSGTPLDWALYGWGAPERPRRMSYYEVVALLVRAGAKLDPEWHEKNEDRRHAAEKIRSDDRMLAALRGETPR